MTVLKINFTLRMKEFLRQQIVMTDFELELFLKRRRRELQVEIERLKREIVEIDGELERLKEES